LSPGALILALKQDSNSNVLQTPSLLVADNEDSTFEATERENILMFQEDPTTKLRTSRIENLDATLSVKIKPQISKADFVSMDVNIKADSFGRRNAENRPEQTNKRSFNTKVTVQNGQTIVVSGLQRDIEIEGRDKVPLLGDIPIIGWLFRNSNTIRNKTTLMIFMTPNVVRSSEDLGKIYDKKIKARDEFLKVFYGSDFKKRDIFKRLKTSEDGQVPVKSAAASQTTEPAAPAPSAAPTPSPSPEALAPAPSPSPSPDAPAMEKLDQHSLPKQSLPSSDANPIVVPGDAGGGGSSGGSVDLSSGAGSQPPPPPPPPPAGE